MNNLYLGNKAKSNQCNNRSTLKMSINLKCSSYEYPLNKNIDKIGHCRSMNKKIVSFPEGVVGGFGLTYNEDGQSTVLYNQQSLLYVLYIQWWPKVLGPVEFSH